MTLNKEKSIIVQILTTLNVIFIRKNKKRANAMTFALKGEMRMLLCSVILFPLS